MYANFVCQRQGWKGGQAGSAVACFLHIIDCSRSEIVVGQYKFWMESKPWPLTLTPSNLKCIGVAFVRPPQSQTINGQIKIIQVFMPGFNVVVFFFSQSSKCVRNLLAWSQYLLANIPSVSFIGDYEGTTETKVNSVISPALLSNYVQYNWNVPCASSQKRLYRPPFSHNWCLIAIAHVQHMWQHHEKAS